MIEIVAGHLLDHPLYSGIADFIAGNGVYQRTTVDYFAAQNGCFAAALDGEKVVGTSLNFDAKNSDFLRQNLSAYLDQAGIPISTCVTPACIYLDPTYSGQKIGDSLSVAKSQHSLSDGYEYTVLWGYETQAIFDYSTRIGNLIDTGVDDQKGFRVYLRKLEDVISALT